MKKQKLKIHQFAVAKAKFATGIVLKTDHSYYLEKGEVYLTFDSKEEALTFMKQTIHEHPEIECWMEDSKGNLVITLDKNGERKRL